VDIARQAGVNVSQVSSAIWVDVDQDGDLDLYVSTWGRTRHHLFINNGTGMFSDQAIERGASCEQPNKRPLRGTTPSVGDFNGDGYPDIFVTEYVVYRDIHNGDPATTLLQNKGRSQPGYFSDVTKPAGIHRDGPRVAQPRENFYYMGAMSPDFSSAFTDLDKDGHVVSHIDDSESIYQFFFVSPRLDGRIFFFLPPLFDLNLLL
jgi:hypothetical protein